VNPRLDAPFGSLIDRNQPRSFTFEGEAVNGYLGDTVASALIANNHWLFSRSFKYHRPRGPLSMAGHDANTLVQTASAPNRLAEELPIDLGEPVSGQNYVGSLKRDWLRALDWLGRFLPVGFYYKAFYKPFGVWRLWEPMIRHMAGLGVANLKSQPPYRDKQYLFCDVAVIGAGPAGLSAALEAANGGARVLLIDENTELGGALTYHRFDTDVESSTALLSSLRQQVLGHQHLRVLSNALCNAWFTDHYLPVLQGDRMFKVRAETCILATGSTEQHVVFRNNDLPGVVLCSALDRLIRHYAIAPAGDVAILAGNDLAYHTALQAHDAGLSVVAVIDLRTSPDDETLCDALATRNIRLETGATVSEALADSDGLRLAKIIVNHLAADGSVAGERCRIACATLAMSAGFMPAYQLACQAGATLSYDDTSAHFKISGLAEGLFLAGSVNSVHTLEAVCADGRNAGRAALTALGRSASATESISCTARVNHPWPIFKHPRGREFVDFDEDLQIKDIVNAARQGYRDIQLVKRFSTVGMGPSQGRHSALPTARLIAKATQRSVTETGVTTARPPVKPELLGLIAGRGFDPHRHTPMHEQHLALGAHMIPAGTSRRPGFYGDPKDRERWIREEALAVRNNVGIIDVSTLGGIELRGPDAAEFMNRLYTFGFLKQPVGRTRYAVLTNEHGVVIDDGVAARIADDHFYVTATTTGVDRVYRDMLKWQAQWRLNLDITNVTAAFAAVNVAGPNARRVLEAAGCDIDLSAEAFPYLDYQEASIAQIPVRMMRVGFVGELGYELHVPSMMAHRLWEIVMAAGEPWGIRPFGVETQRLLRLEKGHIIVGQDTDGMSHPGEVHLAWAVNRKKPFFVGCRSVDIVMQQPLSRLLIGFTLSPDAPCPKEGHLVIKSGDIVGNVTSCEYSPSLDRVIGLAYAHPDDAAPGARITIRTDNGVEVQAIVTTLPFYDPDNVRQTL
jgi:sarcosine oxidase subunit alpha